jgi:anti-anti-sigma factor
MPIPLPNLDDRSYAELAEQARADGYLALWMTGDATWELRRDTPQADRYLEYEQLVERFLATTQDALALCQYDARYDGAPTGPAAADILRMVHNAELSPDQLRPLGRAVLGLSTVPSGTATAVSGEVDPVTWTALQNALRGVAATVGPRQEIVLDLSELEFIDAHGVGLIAQAARELGPARRLVLRGAPQVLLRIAEVLGLDAELAPGAFADAVLLTADGHVERVLRRGRWVR